MTAPADRMAPPRTLSEGAAQLFSLLQTLPLATVGDLIPLSGVASSVVYDRMLELRDAGLVGGSLLGWLRPRAVRWRLVGPGAPGWHHEGLLSRLLERLPSLELFYRFLPEVPGMGSFQEFLWLRGRAADAVARYEFGWVALFWSGLYQSEDVIAGRLSGLAMDLERIRVSRESPWPGMLIFAVSDEWQRQLVYRAARSVGMGGLVTVWCVRDRLFSGAREPSPSRGWVHQALEPPGMGGWSWERRVKECPWSENRGMSAGRALEVVAQWPGCRMWLLRQDVGEPVTGRTAYYACRQLQDFGILETVPYLNRHRYVLTSRGRNVLARRDRMHYSQVARRSGSMSWAERPRLRIHEDGVMNLIGGFMAAKMPVAAGWRHWEDLGRGGGIFPDGMVFLGDGPYGRTWAYLEYERSARGKLRVSQKLRGYGSELRSDRWPALVVCRDDAAEAVFQEVGKGMGVRMLTSTIQRLKRTGPVGSPDCWSNYGERAALG